MSNYSIAVSKNTLWSGVQPATAYPIGDEEQLTLPIYIRAKSQTARCRCGKPLYYPPDSEMAICLECD